MRTRMFAVVCVAGLVPILAGCANRLTLTEDNDGQTVQMIAGGQIILNLATNPTTGFDWKITAIDTAILQQVGDSTYVANASEPGVTGVGGIRTWTFNVISGGATTTLTPGVPRALVSRTPNQRPRPSPSPSKALSQWAN